MNRALVIATLLAAGCTTRGHEEKAGEPQKCRLGNQRILRAVLRKDRAYRSLATSTGFSRGSEFTANDRGVLHTGQSIDVTQSRCQRMVMIVRLAGPLPKREATPAAALAALKLFPIVPGSALATLKEELARAKPEGAGETTACGRGICVITIDDGAIEIEHDAGI